ncbi:hypothetical protein [Segetibacter aerophilus]|uniref:hypothetical protein n=1 Tax=Segetibacter aerophilus TaxID=670293 RepID=UPI0014788AC5|nr:hypothetical protein [Segetibacter aerophilus]
MFWAEAESDNTTHSTRENNLSRVACSSIGLNKSANYRISLASVVTDTLTGKRFSITIWHFTPQTSRFIT